jgi:hypothetical protein
MRKTIFAGFVYFALVLGAGFILGSFRVLFVVSLIGERWAELAEMPIMAVVIYFSAEYVLQHFTAVNFPALALVVGFVALALTISAEFGLAVALQSQTLVEYLTSRDKVSGSVYIGMLVVFTLMPRLLLPKLK